MPSAGAFLPDPIGTPSLGADDAAANAVEEAEIIKK